MFENTMLSNLIIKNFGLVDQLTVDFDKGLNILTGETGAGKSILIDALQVALGGKLSSSHIHDVNSSCMIEAVLDLSSQFLSINPLFSEYIDDDENILIISRTFLPDGRSKNKLNGRTVTVGQLKSIGNRLVDLHGPHDHQMLLSESNHLSMLDALSNIKNKMGIYSKTFDSYLTLKKESIRLEELSANSERELDTLSHQIKELEQVPLDITEHEKLIKESSRVNNAEKLHASASSILELFDNEENGANKIASQAFTFMNILNSTDESTSPLSEILSRIQEDASDLSSLITDYLEELSFHPQRADEVNKRLDIYHELTRKYGPTLEDVMVFYQKAKEKYDLLINLEHNDADIKKQLKSSLIKAEKAASALTEKRSETAIALRSTIEKGLKELGIKNVKFKCQIDKTELSSTGTDKAVFYISPNKGEDLKPLAEIVSSGEAARVMLALKEALTKVDPIPVLIFDEIDAQIGGRLGTVIGEKLKQLSGNRQIILITHLPQIASFGDKHQKVMKTVKNGRTFTEVETLDHKARLKEIAEMMAGDTESDIAVEHASSMLSRGGAKK
ncbi:MAG: DNA repair protein RecN [Candidatus Aadella gelida]|nr:DNA repair protein RecN [Candidatus Aadella gelida]